MLFYLVSCLENIHLDISRVRILTHVSFLLFLLFLWIFQLENKFTYWRIMMAIMLLEVQQSCSFFLQKNKENFIFNYDKICSICRCQARILNIHETKVLLSTFKWLTVQWYIRSRWDEIKNFFINVENCLQNAWVNVYCLQIH